MSREKIPVDIQYHLQSDTLIIQFGEHVFDMPASIVHGFVDVFCDIAQTRLNNGHTDRGPKLTPYNLEGRVS